MKTSRDRRHQREKKETLRSILLGNLFSFLKITKKDVAKLFIQE